MNIRKTLGTISGFILMAHMYWFVFSDYTFKDACSFVGFVIILGTWSIITTVLFNYEEQK